MKNYEEKFFYIFKYNYKYYCTKAKFTNENNKISLYDIKIYEFDDDKYVNFGSCYGEFKDMTYEEILYCLNANYIDDINEYYLVATISQLIFNKEYEIEFNNKRGRHIGDEYCKIYNVVCAIHLKLLMDYENLSFYKYTNMPSFTILDENYNLIEDDFESWNQIKKQLFNYKLESNLSNKIKEKRIKI